MHSYRERMKHYIRERSEIGRIHGYFLALVIISLIFSPEPAYFEIQPIFQRKKVLFMMLMAKHVPQNIQSSFQSFPNSKTVPNI